MKCWLNLSKDCEELVLNECSTVGGQTSFLQSWEHKEQMNAGTAEHKSHAKAITHLILKALIRPLSETGPSGRIRLKKGAKATAI